MFSKRYPVNKTGVVLITGASQGLGNQAALSFDKKGYHVFAGYRKPADGEKLRQQLGPNSQPVQLDASNEEQCVAAVAAIKAYMAEKGVPFTALINNAGVVMGAVVEATPCDSLSRQFEVNATAVLRLSCLVLPLCRQTNGRIVTVTSVSAYMGVPSTGAYAASKAAAMIMLDTLRQECPDVSVSIIAPGPMKTQMTASFDTPSFHPSVSDEVKEHYKTLFPYFSRAEHAMFALIAAKPTQLVALMHHAVSSSLPKARYVNGVMPKMMWFMSLLPPRLVDYMFALTFKVVSVLFVKKPNGSQVQDVKVNQVKSLDAVEQKA